MAADPNLVRIVVAYGDRTVLVRQQVLGYVSRVWGSLSAWRDADIERFVRAVTPVVSGGQIQLAALTDSYLAAAEASITGLPVRPVGVAADLVSDETMRGVAIDDVYRRTGPTVWGSLSEGNTLDFSVAQGLRRALSMASTDLQLAKTHASRQVLARKDHVVGYRRTLTGSHSCGLCVVASTQRYHKADLMPCHPGCNCGVVPIIGDRDPGQVIEPDNLDQVHQAIADRFGTSDASGRKTVDYRKALVTHEHGEIGPVLAVRGQRFTSAADLP